MSEALWAAVDAITKPTSMRVWRDDLPGDLLNDLSERKQGWCDVPTYRNSTSGHGTVPSLWDQAEMALYKTGETQDGNRSPLATRSPADVALMEVMLSMRELIAEFFKQDDKPVPSSSDLPRELRHMASEILRHNTHVDVWAYRIEQFRRLLETHLQAIDRGPKPMRLRTRCPTCRTEFITVEDPEGNLGKDGKPLKLVLRPILAVYRDRWFRCFECQSCTSTWFAGAGVHQLHKEIQDDEDQQDQNRLQEMTG